MRERSKQEMKNEQNNITLDSCDTTTAHTMILLIFSPTLQKAWLKEIVMLKMWANVILHRLRIPP